MGHSHITLGINISDGSPNTMLEGMIMGAFPIQSNASAADEWITNGKNDLLVPSDDPKTIAASIIEALTNDELVDNATKLNSKIATARLDRFQIKKEVIAQYEKIYRSA